MVFAEAFAENTGIGYGDHIYMNSQTGIFTVGKRSFQLAQEEGAIVAFFLTAQLIYPNGVTGEQLANQFGEGALKSLLKNLEDFHIANDGGNGGLFYEDSITGRDLFVENEGKYKFNTKLAGLLKFGDILSDQQLDSIKYVPHWYRPMACCL